MKLTTYIHLVPKFGMSAAVSAVALYNLMMRTRTALSLPFAFQYLQLRFNRSVRVMASVLFTISVLLYVPLVIYVPALAFSYGKN